MRRWVTATGGYSRDGADLPAIKFFRLDESPAEFRKWVDEQVVEDLVQFYPRDAIGPADCYNGPVLEPEDRVRDIFEAIDEGEDTLFTKVDEAREQLLNVVIDHILKHEGWEHQTFMDSSEGGYVMMELREIT